MSWRAGRVGEMRGEKERGGREREKREGEGTKWIMACKDVESGSGRQGGREG